MIIFGGPRRYIQGPDAIKQIGGELAGIGKDAILIADRTILDICGGDIKESAEAEGVSVDKVEFFGESTYSEIDRMSAAIEGRKPDMIIGAGGGKAIDAAKLVSHKHGTAFVSVPTIASNDSPTSHIAVVYDAAHRMVAVEKMRSNPDLVVVDTSVIAKAPLILLSAGVGDAVVKFFEVSQCYHAGGPNIFGGQAPLSSLALARACYDALRANVSGAYKAHAAGQPDAAFEAVVEAAILMSGLAFESGGVSVSHGMTRGLSAVPAVANALHGHQVAYGLLVQFALEKRDDDFMADMRGFYREAGLPLTLSELGASDISSSTVESISTLSAAAAHMKNFQSEITATDIAQAINQVESA